MATTNLTRSQTPADVNVPAMPRLAEKARQDLARPLRATSDGLRAIDAWFRHHGDPFVPLEPLSCIAELDRQQDTYETLTNAELIARLWSAFGVLSARLKTASAGGLTMRPTSNASC